jgi:hypothetical protein
MMLKNVSRVRAKLFSSFAISHYQGCCCVNIYSRAAAEASSSDKVMMLSNTSSTPSTTRPRGNPTSTSIYIRRVNPYD